MFQLVQVFHSSAWIRKSLLSGERPVIDVFLQGGGRLPKYQWTSTQSDKNGGWNTMTEELLEMQEGANLCAMHLGLIGFKTGTHAKYIDHRD